MDESKVLNNISDIAEHLPARETNKRTKTTKMEEKIRKTGIDIIGDIPWGTHICQFYQTKEDLLDILVPYFKAGLENNEFCMWVCWDPLRAEEAKVSLSKTISNIDNYIERGQIEIVDYSKRYTVQGDSGFDNMKQFWVEKEKLAFERGFEGLRLAGNTYWLERNEWKDFTKYEEEVDGIIRGHKMLAICPYSLDRCSAGEIIDVVSNHGFALIRQESKWNLIESSERKKTEEALRVSEQKFKDLTETTTDWMWEVDKDGIYTYTNPKVKELLGYEVSEVLGKTPFDLMPKEEAERIGKIFKKKAINKEPFYKLENVNRHNDGHLVVLETNGIPIFNEKGQLKGYRGIDRDITERKKAEEKLRQSEEKWRVLAETAPVVILTVNHKGIIQFLNRAVGEYTTESAVGTSVYNYVPADQREIMKRQIEYTFKTGKSTSYQIFGAGSQGPATAWYETQVGPIHNNGQVTAVTLVCVDITDRKKTEEVLKKSELELREQKLALEQKNLALKEIVEHIERTKNRMEEDIAINVDESLLPILKKLKLKGASPKYVNLLQHHLEELTSSFGRKITAKSIKLTSREIEICNMIKGGLTSKEIAGLLNISCQTVEKHRKNIRHKIGLSNKGVNLSSFLLHKL